MSLAVLYSRALDGMHAHSVTVEVHLANGMPTFTIVGLPDTEVRESKDRVRAALLSSGFEIPSKRITVNLAPADLPKDSARFDLAIALGILIASGQIKAKNIHQYEFAGELSLSGALLPVRGALAMSAALVKSAQRRQFILPTISANEAAQIKHAEILAADHLSQVIKHFTLADHTLTAPTHVCTTAFIDYPDLKDVKGQPQAKRALEIAASGAHNLLFIGPPGTGKSMLASRLPSILPPLTDDEALESASILSITGQFHANQWKQRIYRQPHHSSSSAALVGGGSTPRPGEISLAHHGVLFLDELPEFDRKVLEVLREPIENGKITISRAARQVEYPAKFQLIAAMNPCPCGYLGQARCRCSPEQVKRYQSKISGPLLDRFDMIVEVPPLDQATLLAHANSEPSADIQRRVIAARAQQNTRQQKANQWLSNQELEQYASPDSAGKQLLEKAITRLNLSARAYHRILKLARTIADLDLSEHIHTQHIAQAIQYRRGLVQHD